MRSGASLALRCFRALRSGETLSSSPQLQDLSGGFGDAQICLSRPFRVSFFACGPATDLDEETTASAEVAAGSPEAARVLALVNDPNTSFELLDGEGALDRRAARNIVAHRDGPDGFADTSDDDLFDDLAELDAVPYVGPSALRRLLELAQSQAGPGPGPGTDRDSLILLVVNDPALGLEALDDDVGLDARAARNIMAFRVGADGVWRTADDRTFATIAQLDDIKYVGDSALQALFDYAVANGYGTSSTVQSEAIFSPQPYALSHNSRVQQLIDGAQSSVDIAMYSFSDEGIFDAIEAATGRGVRVRFIFETANEDRKLTGAGLAGTRSARLERMGVNVRYVNKIMHHKFAIIDGPRDDAALAASARIVSGSGNWSYGAATRYDENTVFLTGYASLALSLQREFNHMWAHSRDFVFDASLPYELSTHVVTDAEIRDDPRAGAYFTSNNFSVSGNTFRIVSGRNTVSDVLVAAIEGATSSIRVASGHLRSRPVAEALLAKKAANPNMDIRVYLDGQEYISSWYHDEQLSDLSACLAGATTASQQRHCTDKGFYFGYQLHLAGIDVRYKYYSYRWHYSYAVQMHHKLMIIDGDELWMGSYNLSDNAEHNTFENVMVFRGDELQPMIDTYEANFEALYETRRNDSTYEDLIDEITTDSVIPLVFTPMALDWDQVTALKTVIRNNCADINSEPFRSEPENHRTCDR